jgi:type I restriction enzyme S subunit
LKAVLEQLDERNVGGLQTMMSLKSNGQVVPRSTLGERQEPDPANIPRYLVARPGDLIVNPMWLTGGAVGVTEATGAVSPDYRVFRSNGRHHPRYLHHLMRTRPYLDQYVLYTRANTTFDRRVQQDDLDNLPLPIPPMNEQISIAAAIDEQTKKVDHLIGRAERFIGLARERRAALVSAAVTGRIDVRGAV